MPLHHHPVRRAAGAAGLAIAIAAGLAACGGGDDGSAAGSSPANPPATLRAGAFSPGRIVASGPLHDPDVTIDPRSGRVFLSWARDRPRRRGDDFAPQDLYVATSTDGGATFSSPARVNHDGGSVGAGFNVRAKLAITGPGSVLATYPHSMNEVAGKMVMQTQLSRSTDGGRTWSRERAAVAADGGAASDMYQGVAVSGRDVYVGFYDYRTHKAPALSQGIAVVHSGDRGRTFDGTTVAETTSCACCNNALIADRKGTVFFAYRNANFATSKTQERDTAVVRSFDKGKTWSDPVFMGHEHWKFNGCPESGPELALDSADVLHGIYYTGVAGRPGVYYTTSRDEGASFAHPVPVATATFFPPANMDLAIDDRDAGWIVWDDRSTKHHTVWLARAQGGSLTRTAAPVADGEEPAVDSTNGLTVMTWRDGAGVRVATRGRYRPSQDKAS